MDCGHAHIFTDEDFAAAAIADEVQPTRQPESPAMNSHQQSTRITDEDGQGDELPPSAGPSTRVTEEDCQDDELPLTAGPSTRVTEKNS